MAREIDGGTGLYYVRNRWYDAALGRFISEDPIGLAGGVNWYAYAGNSPTNLRDPTGLDPCDPVCVLPGVLVRAFATDWGPMLRAFQNAFGGSGGGGPSIAGGGGSGGGGLGVPASNPTRDFEQCFQDHQFSSLFEGTPVHGLARFAEIGAPISLAGDAAAIWAKGRRMGAGGRSQSYASGMNYLFRRAGQAVSSPRITGALVSLGDRLTLPIAVVGAFSLGYNASTAAQCSLGVL